MMQAPTVAVSWGELIDKITILEIKDAKLTSETARRNVRKELDQLIQSADVVLTSPIVAALKLELREINATLWDIENNIREKEARQQFDQQFIDLARSVYISNDVRAALKRKINDTLLSDLREEKSYGV
jgi:Family of unknown function (DUF6165)